MGIWQCSSAAGMAARAAHVQEQSVIGESAWTLPSSLRTLPSRAHSRPGRGAWCASCVAGVSPHPRPRPRPLCSSCSSSQDLVAGAAGPSRGDHIPCVRSAPSSPPGAHLGAAPRGPSSLPACPAARRQSAHRAVLGSGLAVCEGRLGRMFSRPCRRATQSIVSLLSCISRPGAYVSAFDMLLVARSWSRREAWDRLCSNTKERWTPRKSNNV